MIATLRCLRRDSRDFAATYHLVKCCAAVVTRGNRDDDELLEQLLVQCFRRQER